MSDPMVSARGFVDDLLQALRGEMPPHLLPILMEQAERWLVATSRATSVSPLGEEGK